MPVVDSIHIDFQEAKIKHLLFKSRLRALLYDERVEDDAPVIYHYECLVGKWLYSKALSEYSHIPEIHDLEQVHTHLHTIARDLVRQYKDGHVDSARSGLQKVEDVADKFIVLLELVEKQVCSSTVQIKSVKRKEEQVDISKTDIFYELVRKNEILDKVIKKQASELVISQYMLNNFFMQAPGFFCILKGPEHRFELVNDAYLRLIGKKNLLGKPIREVLPELAGQSFIELLDNVYDTQKIYAGSETEVLLDKGKGYTESSYIDFVYQPMLNVNKEVEGIMVFGYDVTDQVVTRKKIRASERHFRDLVMQSPVPMGVLRGNDFIIDLANEALLKEIWRRDLSEVKGKKLQNVFPEIKKQGLLNILNEVYKTGVSCREKESLVYINDKNELQKFYLDFEYSALFENDDDLVTGIVITLIDVTEKVETRNRINEMEQRSRLAIEAAKMGTFEWNMKTGEFISSPRLIEIFGFDREVTHQDLVDCIHPDDISLRNATLQQSLENGSLTYELRFIWPDQSLHWVRVHGKTIYDENRNPVRMYGTALDITAQKKILNELTESEAKFRLLADSMPQLIWTGDEKGNLNYFNKAVFDYSGLSHDDLANEKWINIVHPEDQKENIEKWTYSIKNGIEFKVEHRFRKHNGEYRWQLSRALPQKDSKGNIQMWVGTSTDIQEHKNFQHILEEQVKARTQSLLEVNDSLEKSNKELQQFAYVASHDLQEPLRKISTFSNMIRHKFGQSLPEESIEYLDKINFSAKRMTRLIEDLLNFSRTTGTSEVFIDTDLNEVLDSTLVDFDELMQQKNAVIKIDPLPVIRANALQMTQLFHNLISNSLKFSREDLAPLIHISSQTLSKEDALEYSFLSKRKKYIRMVFEDNGIGFEQEYAEKIFTIFQRLNDKSMYSGTGIGLALCKKIIDNHEGYIFATSELGKGAKFTIFLPR